MILPLGTFLLSKVDKLIEWYRKRRNFARINIDTNTYNQTKIAAIAQVKGYEETGRTDDYVNLVLKGK